MKMEKKDPLYRSFGYAFQGIFTCVRKERNMKIHCVAAVLVVIAVESYDERIDPVGACVGVKGSRIHGIVRELRNEIGRASCRERV